MVQDMSFDVSWPSVRFYLFSFHYLQLTTKFLKYYLIVMGSEDKWWAMDCGQTTGSEDHVITITKQEKKKKKKKNSPRDNDNISQAVGKFFFFFKFF